MLEASKRMIEAGRKFSDLLGKNKFCARDMLRLEMQCIAFVDQVDAHIKSFPSEECVRCLKLLKKRVKALLAVGERFRKRSKEADL